MPRVKLLKFHVYDGKTLTYSGLGLERPLTEAEEDAIPCESRESRAATADQYQIATWLDGPRAGEEGIVFVEGDNWIPAHWHVRSGR